MCFMGKLFSKTTNTKKQRPNKQNESATSRISNNRMEPHANQSLHRAPRRKRKRNAPAAPAAATAAAAAAAAAAAMF